MFPADSLPVAYCEERAAADEQRRLAKQQSEAAQKTQQAAPQAQQSPTGSLGQALMQRPPMSRPNSSGLLGNIFQNFAKAGSVSPSPSQCATPVPGQAKQVTCEEIARLIAEQKRDADICAMPSW